MKARARCRGIEFTTAIWRITGGPSLHLPVVSGASPANASFAVCQCVSLRVRKVLAVLTPQSVGRTSKRCLCGNGGRLSPVTPQTERDVGQLRLRCFGNTLRDLVPAYLNNPGYRAEPNGSLDHGLGH